MFSIYRHFLLGLCLCFIKIGISHIQEASTTKCSALILPLSDFFSHGLPISLSSSSQMRAADLTGIKWLATPHLGCPRYSVHQNAAIWYDGEDASATACGLQMADSQGYPVTDSGHSQRRGGNAYSRCANILSL